MSCFLEPGLLPDVSVSMFECVIARTNALHNPRKPQGVEIFSLKFWQNFVANAFVCLVGDVLLYAMANHH